MSESLDNSEWHREQGIRTSKIASEMVRIFMPGHDAVQSNTYNLLQQQYLWEEYRKDEHDKFADPDYGDHIRG